MKEEEIKSLPFVKEFTDYFMRRGKRVLGLKEKEFETASIDVHPERKTIWIWFYIPEKVIGRAQFTFDGKQYGDKIDNRKEK